MEIKRFNKSSRMSQTVVHNSTVYLSGIVPSDHTADIAGQTRQVLDAIDQRLALAGSDKSKLLSAQVMLSDRADFAAMNAVWEAWIDPANPPARMTVQAQVISPSARIEIMVIAAV
jgi:enamine deaminase RidA (YjgF/YER057c/UK114 family)